MSTLATLRRRIEKLEKRDQSRAHNDVEIWMPFKRKDGVETDGWFTVLYVDGRPSRCVFDPRRAEVPKISPVMPVDPTPELPCTFENYQALLAAGDVAGAKALRVRRQAEKDAQRMAEIEEYVFEEE